MKCIHVPLVLSTCVTFPNRRCKKRKQQNKNKQNRTEQMVKITLAIRKCEILEKIFKFGFDKDNRRIIT